jgi:hypothetical protein
LKRLPTTDKSQLSSPVPEPGEKVLSLGALGFSLPTVPKPGVGIAL